MLRVTSQAFHERVTAGQEEIILQGPPGDLRGHITLSNPNDDTLKVRSLPLLTTQSKENSVVQSAIKNPLRLSCRLQPGEEKMVELLHQVAPTTPPGTYEHAMMIGGENKKVRIIIQPEISINIHPAHFTFTGSAPGIEHVAIFTLTNLGNMPFTIPEVRHVAALDMDFLCRAFGMGMRSGGHGGVVQMLDDVTRNMQAHLADWAHARIEEYGNTVEPGQKTLIHLHITMPANSDGKKDYSGDIRFWDEDISYMVKAK
jgi:hypothetical protein